MCHLSEVGVRRAGNRNRVWGRAATYPACAGSPRAAISGRPRRWMWWPKAQSH